MIYYIFIYSLLHYIYIGIKFICIGIENKIKQLDRIVNTVNNTFIQIEEGYNNVLYIINYINNKVKKIKNNLRKIFLLK